jgi:hypothetical protein
VEVLQKISFRRLDLSPSSGGWGKVDLLCWAHQKELVSITGRNFHIPDDGQSPKEAKWFCIDNRCFENVAQFRYLGTTITNQIPVQEEVKETEFG